MLEPDSSLDPDEQELIMTMYKSWGHARAEGRAEGNAEARARDVLTVLRVRGVAVLDAIRERILAQKDVDQLERWLEKASIATTIGDVIDLVDQPS